MAAAALGHDRAARELAAKMAASGQAGAAEELLRYLHASGARWPAMPAWPTGIALDPGEDPLRTIQVRSAGVGSIQGVAVNAAMASVYGIIRWLPETDGKK